MSLNALRTPLRVAGKRAFRAPRPAFRPAFNSGRKFSTAPPPPETKSSSSLYLGLGAAAAAGAAWYFFSDDITNATKSGVQQAKVATNFVPTKEDYEKVCGSTPHFRSRSLTERSRSTGRSLTSSLMQATTTVSSTFTAHNAWTCAHISVLDGSYGPVLVRLAWHASGTYDKETGTGGRYVSISLQSKLEAQPFPSNYATMRFEPESLHGANAGLNVARDILEKIKQEFPWISYGDLWTLAGVAAIQVRPATTLCL